MHYSDVCEYEINMLITNVFVYFSSRHNFLFRMNKTYFINTEDDYRKNVDGESKYQLSLLGVGSF